MYMVRLLGDRDLTANVTFQEILPKLKCMRKRFDITALHWAVNTDKP